VQDAASAGEGRDEQQKGEDFRNLAGEGVPGLTLVVGETVFFGWYVPCFFKFPVPVTGNAGQGQPFYLLGAEDFIVVGSVSVATPALGTADQSCAHQSSLGGHLVVSTHPIGANGMCVFCKDALLGQKIEEERVELKA